MIRFLIFLFYSTFAFAQVQQDAQDNFVTRFPELEKFVFTEPKSDFYFGYGMAPVGFVRQTPYSAISFFQLHWLKGIYDVEVLNASIGITMSSDSTESSNHFTIRFAPKIKVYGPVSIGPCFGIEHVRFPGVKMRLFKDTYVTPEEPYSSRGMFFGLVVSQSFPWRGDYILKASQIYIRQAYPNDKTDEGWRYVFSDPNIQDDPAKVAGGDVFMLEFSLLY